MSDSLISIQTRSLLVGIVAVILLAASHAQAQAPSNPGYRVQVYVNSNSGNVNLPTATQSWQIEYQYKVPPLPSSSTWDYTTQTIYQWGDVDFDSYGSNGTYKLSDYVYNQIVPQLFIGNVISGHSAHYHATGSTIDSWAIQAQYYWQKGTTPYAKTGHIIYVNPGDNITTVIKYDSQSGKIVVSIMDDNISCASGKSTITLYRPFPDQPSLFSSWRDFFTRGEALSHNQFIIGHPVLNVETAYADQQTVCALLPFNIESVSIPGISSTPSQFAIQPVGGLSCSQPLATLNF